MSSFGYTIGDGSGTNTAITAVNQQWVESSYSNPLGANLVVTSIDLLNVNHQTYSGGGTQSAQLAVYSAPAGIAFQLQGVSDVLLTALTPGSNTFSFSTPVVIRKDERVSVAILVSSGLLIFCDGIVTTTPRLTLEATRPHSFPAIWTPDVAGPRNLILPVQINGTLDPAPGAADLRLSNIILESSDDGYSNVRLSNILLESSDEGYSNLRLSNVILESSDEGYSTLRCCYILLETLIPIPREAYMSTEKFPELKGLSFNVIKKPNFNTRVSRSINGREVRSAFMENPTWDYQLTYDYLPDKSTGLTDLKTLMGLFLKMKGQFDTFLFKDPDDYSTTLTEVATSDGLTTQYYFSRDLGGFVEPVGQINTDEAYAVYVDGILQVEGTDYNITLPNIFVFVVAPDVDKVITNTLEYYFVCRFSEDSQEYDKFMDKLWELQTCSFTSVIS